MTTPQEAVAALQAAADAYHGKVADINQRMNTAEQDLENWKNSAFNNEDATLNVAIGSRKLIDLTHLASDIFYPLFLHGDYSHVNEYEISRGYSEPRPGNDYAGLFLKFAFVGDISGGNPVTLMIHQCQQTYRVTLAHWGMQISTKPLFSFVAGIGIIYLTTAIRILRFLKRRRSTPVFPIKTVRPAPWTSNMQLCRRPDVQRLSTTLYTASTYRR